MTRAILIPSFSRFGGTRTYYEQLLKFYNQKKVRLVVALTSQQINEGGADLALSYGFKIYKIPNRSRKIGMILWKTPFKIIFDLFIGLYLIIRFKPDLIVISEATPGIYIGMFILPIRIIYILHTAISGSVYWPTSFLLKYCLNKRKVIVTVSEFAKQTIVKFWLNNNKKDHIKVIYNTGGRLIKCKKKSKNNKLTILTLGHVVAYKNPFFWIELAQKIIQEIDERIEFIWAGDGKLLGECLNRINALKTPNIKFIGYVDNVDKLYAESDIYFQPSLIENLSISVLGAMKWGLPCIVSKNGGLPETVINNKTGFIIDTNSVDNAFKKIVKLALDSNLRHQMGEAALVYYKEKFSKERWYKNMEILHWEIMV